MAEYIDDSAAYGRDAHFQTGAGADGVKGTDYDYDATEEAVWFSSTGKADTNFVLPDSEWLVYEVYDMTGTGITNSLTGSTKLRGRTEWTSTIDANVVTQMNTWRTAFNSGQGANYTTYEVIVTHYKGSDEADTYEADKTTAFATATQTNGTFTDHSSAWFMTDDLLADGVGSLTEWSQTIQDTYSDVEEVLGSGTIRYNSSDLELAYDGSEPDNVIVGLWFSNVTIAKDTTINSAYVQFTAKEASLDNSLTLNCYCELTGDSIKPTNSTSNISNRTRTTTTVTWSPPQWVSTDDKLAAQKTPDLKTIIQDVVDHASWVSGNDLLIIIEDLSETTNYRNAVSYDAASGVDAPTLTITY